MADNQKDRLVRINSRVRIDQHKFVKGVAKRDKRGEGEIHREIIDFYMTHHK